MPAAVTDAYATAAEYRAAIKKTDSTLDAAILTDLTAVSRYIDGQLHRFFTKDASAVSRIYYPRSNSRNLLVDDIASTSGFAIKVDFNLSGTFTDETAFATTDYQLLPLNAANGSEAAPWDEIYIPIWSAQVPFVRGLPVQVTAIFGWPAVPAAIKRACIDLTGILRLETPRAERTMNVSMNQMMSTSRQAQDIVQGLMSSYGRAVFA